MAKNILPPADVLRQLLEYDPASGELTWKTRTPEVVPYSAPSHLKAWNTRYAGKPAGKSHKGGYYTISLFRQCYGAHRVIWKLVHDVEPRTIDHINGNGMDNRLENLRNVSQLENCKNQAMFPNNTSGFKGVSWNERDGRWNAYITANGKRVQIGKFETILDAAEARRFAEKVFGFHPNHGRRHRLS